MRKATRKLIEKLRKSLLASIDDLRDGPHSEEAEAQAVLLLHECLLDMVTRLPTTAADRATYADAIILTRAQMHEMLVRFGIDLLALGEGVRERDRHDG